MPVVKIKNISRRAKLVVMELSNNLSIIIHLKLTGRLLYDIKPDSERVRSFLTEINRGNVK